MKGAFVFVLLAASCVSVVFAARELSEEIEVRVVAAPCNIQFESVSFTPLASCDAGRMTFESCCPQLDAVVQPFIDELSTNFACANSLDKQLEHRGYVRSSFDLLCQDDRRELMVEESKAPVSKPPKSGASTVSVPYFSLLVLLVAGVFGTLVEWREYDEIVFESMRILLAANGRVLGV